MSADSEPFQRELLHIEAEYLGSEVIIVLEGEFDMTVTTRFWAHISEALEGHATSVTVDARGVTFIDSLGVGALLRARAEADERGVRFGVTEPSPALRRVLEVAGIEDLLPRRVTRSGPSRPNLGGRCAPASPRQRHPASERPGGGRGVHL